MNNHQNTRPKNSTCLRLVADLEEFTKASQLVYSQYTENNLIAENWHRLYLSLTNLLPCSATMIGKQNSHIVATLTSVFAQPSSLPSGKMFEELEFNINNHTTVEGTKFAINRKLSDSDPSLAAGIISACEELWISRGISTAYVVVHPRHVAFWKKRFRFSAISQPKPCGRVLGSPGVLLQKDLPPTTHSISTMRESSFTLNEQEAGMFFLLNRSIFGEASATQRQTFLNVYPKLSRFTQPTTDRTTIVLSPQPLRIFSNNIKTILSNASITLDVCNKMSENKTIIADGLHIFASMVKILESVAAMDIESRLPILQISLNTSHTQEHILTIKISIDQNNVENRDALEESIEAINKLWHGFSNRHYCKFSTIDDSTNIIMQFPLPLISAPAHTSANESMIDVLESLEDNSRLVLVATSCPTEGMFLATLLKRLGFQPLIASQGDSALKIASSYPLHFAVISFHLPQINIGELSASIKARQYGVNDIDLTIFGLSSSQTQRKQMLARFPDRLAEVFSVPYSAKDVILALIRSNLLEWEHEWQPLPPFQESYWSNIPTSDLVVGATNL